MDNVIAGLLALGLVGKILLLVWAIRSYRAMQKEGDDFRRVVEETWQLL